MKKICTCGHAAAEHTISQGPEGNIAQWVSRLCSHGGQAFGPYFVTECKCYGYKFSLLGTVRELVKR